MPIFSRVALAAALCLSRVVPAGAAFGQTSEEERKALEGQLAELEAQISEHEATIKDLSTKRRSYESEITRYNAKIAAINLQIKAVNLKLGELDRQITEKTTQIRSTEEQITFNKDVLTRALRKLYARDQASLAEVLLQSAKLSDAVSDINRLIGVQTNLAATTNRITQLRDDLVEAKEVLALKRSDAAALKNFQKGQQNDATEAKKERATLLAVTKGKESKFQEILVQTKKTAAQVRGRLYEMLGGGAMAFGQAYQFARLASGATGVRASFILAILDRESALGQNVGRCKYDDINPATGRITMHPTRDVPAFRDILAELNLSPEAVTVSCANRDGAYGGAMGPAQFIPSTWKLYTSRITTVTGNSPPSPWRNADAFVATALYLRDAGALTNELAAAKRYYCGSNSSRYACTVYGRATTNRAAAFEEDIKVLNG